MMIVGRSRIEEVLADLELVPLIERAFVDYSAGRAIVPPVGELLLDGGDVHIKYGAIRGGDYYVIKVASAYTRLHSDPRWTELRNSIGMSEERLAAIEFDPKLPE